MNRFTLLFILSIFFFIACEKTYVEPEDQKITDESWSVELVDSIAGIDAGVFNMLSYDADSGIHIAYIIHEGTDKHLKYAYKPYGGNWSTTLVASDIDNDEIDLVIDNQNHIVIAYEAGDDYLYLAEKSLDENFSHVLVDVLGDRSYQARYPALFADDNGIIYLSFERANYGMRYTTHTFQGGFTEVQVLNDDFSGSRSDIVIDSKGNKHILFHDNNGIDYGYCEKNASEWTVSTVAQLEGSYQSYEGVSLTIDNNDNLHGVYRSGYSDNNIIYLFYGNSSTSWSYETIGNIGGSSRIDRAIACDTLNNPHILFDQNFGLYMASVVTGWQFEHIEGDSDYRCDRNYDIEITEKNRAHVSYYCRTTGVLRYATKQL
jgi:hypothetical protein